MQMKNSLFLVAVFLLTAHVHLWGEDKITLPSKEKFYLVLMIGQSNMAGRGFVTEEDKIPFPRVFMLNRAGEWVPATDPVHYDKKSAGVGMGRTFARLMTEMSPDIAVGLIPAACGGSSLESWKSGVYFKGTRSNPYDDAVARAKKAMESGTLKVILFHQGEGDCKPGKDVQYEKRLVELVRNLRKELNAEQVPLLIGELSSWSRWNKSKVMVDAAHHAAVEQLQPATFVSARGLTPNPDKIHFDRKSQLIFGERYFKAYQELLKKNP